MERSWRATYVLLIHLSLLLVLFLDSEEKRQERERECSAKVPCEFSSIIYHCAIHNHPTFSRDCAGFGWLGGASFKSLLE